MSCYRPLAGYRLEGGGISVEYEPEGSISRIRLPCGRCIGCRLERSLLWSVRCRHEASLWDYNCFATLTYDDEHLPEGASLRSRDLQLLLKRVRASIEGYQEAPDGRKPVRFFAAGEYGGRTARPHFHVLLFNTRLSRGRRVSEETWESPELSELWPYGSNAVGAVSAASAAYVAQYSLKKVYGRADQRKHYEAVDPVTGEILIREQEFVRMSRRPGLGRWWLDRYRSDIERGYLIVDGRKVRLPRYYRDAYPELSRRFDELDDEFRASVRPQTDEALEATEETVKARRRLFHRGRDVI